MTAKTTAWLDLIHAVASVEAELASVLQAGHGLGLSDYRALDALSQAPDSELRMQELAACLHLNQSSVSRMVERLERGGLTLRDLCPDDKRGVYTVLTDKGRARCETARPDYDAVLADALAKHRWADMLTLVDAQG